MRTYVVFYKPSGLVSLGLVERLYRAALWLYQRGKLTYHHVGLLVEFDDGSSLVSHLTWDGADMFDLRDLNKAYTLDKVEVYFDYDALSNSHFWAKEYNVRVSLVDAVRVFFKQKYHSPLCTDFVNGVLYEDKHLGYKHNRQPETPDQLYVRLADNRRTTEQRRLLASVS